MKIALILEEQIAILVSPLRPGLIYAGYNQKIKLLTGVTFYTLTMTDHGYQRQKPATFPCSIPFFIDRKPCSICVLSFSFISVIATF